MSLLRGMAHLGQPGNFVMRIDDNERLPLPQVASMTPASSFFSFSIPCNIPSFQDITILKMAAKHICFSFINWLSFVTFFSRSRYRAVVTHSPPSKFFFCLISLQNRLTVHTMPGRGRHKQGITFYQSADKPPKCDCCATPSPRDGYGRSRASMPSRRSISFAIC